MASSLRRVALVGVRSTHQALAQSGDQGPSGSFACSIISAVIFLQTQLESPHFARAWLDRRAGGGPCSSDARGLFPNPCWIRRVCGRLQFHHFLAYRDRQLAPKTARSSVRKDRARIALPMKCSIACFVAYDCDWAGNATVRMVGLRASHEHGSSTLKKSCAIHRRLAPQRQSTKTSSA